MAYFISDFPPLLIKKASFVLISRASVYLRFLDSRFRLLPWDFYEVVNVIVKVCFVFYLFSLVSLDLFTFRSVEGKHFLNTRYTIFHLLSIFNKCLANLIGNFLPSKYRAIDEIRQFYTLDAIIKHESFTHFNSVIVLMKYHGNALRKQ